MGGRVGRAAAALLGLVALVAAGCSRGPSPRPPASDPRRPTITVASFDFTESQTLAEIYGQALRRAGYPVELVPQLGPREIVGPALEQGKVDLVPEYLGTALNFYYNQQRVATADPRATHAALQDALQPLGLRVLAYASAQDRNGYVVTGDFARQHRVAKLSDLRPYAATLVFGGPPECPERPLCYQGLRDLYGLEFARFEPMPSRTVTAAALESGEIGVGMLETTDGNLAGRDLVQLEDDRHLQPAENVAPVVRQRLLQVYGERLQARLDAVTALITTKDLIGLNRQVEVEGQPPDQVAAGWLDRHLRAG